MENIDRVPDMDEATKKQYVAEAGDGLRPYCYNRKRRTTRPCRGAEKRPN